MVKFQVQAIDKTWECKSSLFAAACKLDQVHNLVRTPIIGSTLATRIMWILHNNIPLNFLEISHFRPSLFLILPSLTTKFIHKGNPTVPKITALCKCQNSMTIRLHAIFGENLII